MVRFLIIGLCLWFLLGNFLFFVNGNPFWVFLFIYFLFLTRILKFQRVAHNVFDKLLVWLCMIKLTWVCAASHCVVVSLFVILFFSFVVGSFYSKAIACWPMDPTGIAMGPHQTYLLHSELHPYLTYKTQAIHISLFLSEHGLSISNGDTFICLVSCVHILACAHTHALNMSLCLHIVRCHEVGSFIWFALTSLIFRGGRISQST